jgi:hypothetical protein
MELVKIADHTSSNDWPSSIQLIISAENSAEFLSYSYLCGAGPTTETRLIEIPETRLRSLLKVVLSFVDIDESWYLQTNPDVAHEVTNGRLASARAHYIDAGFYENRWPYKIIVDESWYQTEYPDVKTAITRGSVESCQDHFNRYGFLEGRLPSMGWSLLTRRPARKGPEQDK